jgi:hypothetical protein
MFWSDDVMNNVHSASEWMWFSIDLAHEIGRQGVVGANADSQATIPVTCACDIL